MSVSRKLHYCGSSYSPGYTSDFLGIPIDLGYQLRDFSVSVLTWKMGLRIREILIAIPNNRTKFSLHFRFLQALQGEHPLPAGSFLCLIRKMTYLQMNAPLISNLLTSLYILLREYIHDRKLCMLDHAVAFLSKIQHSLISIVK